MPVGLLTLKEGVDLQSHLHVNMLCDSVLSSHHTHFIRNKHSFTNAEETKVNVR